MSKPSERRMNEKTTHFGFQDVPEAEKAGRVRGVFGSVASKYDVMNDAMSFGIHRDLEGCDDGLARAALRSAASRCGGGDGRYRLSLPAACRARAMPRCLT